MHATRTALIARTLLRHASPLCVARASRSVCGAPEEVDQHHGRRGGQVAAGAARVALHADAARAQVDARGVGVQTGHHGAHPTQTRRRPRRKERGGQGQDAARAAREDLRTGRGPDRRRPARTGARTGAGRVQARSENGRLEGVSLRRKQHNTSSHLLTCTLIRDPLDSWEPLEHPPAPGQWVVLFHGRRSR
ncbi:hypothetical protein L1887_57823 [Cichorium endivia]|nr:hypothetical protein L1887_57823 [Cichorium endivia]